MALDASEKMCIKRVPIFNHLKLDYLEKIMKLSKVKYFKKNEDVFYEDSKSDNLFIVHKGQVTLYKLDESGKEVILNVLNVGDYLGEISLFLDSHYQSFAKATKDTTICTIYREDLLKLLDQYPQISIKLLEEFAQRLKLSQTQASRAISKTADSRLALYLIDSVDENSIVKLETSRKDLAKFLGMSAETISRKFKSFENKKYIKQIKTDKIEILDKEKLKTV